MNNIIENHHISTLLKESFNILCIKRGAIYADLTVGSGGHLNFIAKEVGSTGIVLGVDKDKRIFQTNTVINLCRKYKHIKLFHDNFSNIQKIMIANNIKGLNGFICDLIT